MFIGPDGHAMSAEEVAAMQDRAKMQWEDFCNRFTEMVTTGLSFEQLQCVAGVLSLISSNNNPGQLANFYEGICAGALAVRKKRCDEGEDEANVLLGNSNDPREIQ